jgi:phosphatidylserine decarboxylase
VEHEPARVARGEEIGRFNLGSTVVVVFEPNAVRWEPPLRDGTTVLMGQALGRVEATVAATRT